MIVSRRDVAVAAAIARSALRFRGLWGALGWMVVAVLTARGARGEGADGPVLGVLGPLVVPLVSFGVVSACLFGEGLGRTVAPFVALGASRLRALCILFVVTAGASALACALAAAATVGLARASSDPAGDLGITAAVAALAGAAYAATFLGASAFGKRGGGRGVLLAIDFVIGGAGGLGGAVTVRGHLQNLFGGEAPLALPQGQSSLALLGLIALGCGVALARLSPPAARVRPRAT